MKIFTKFFVLSAMACFLAGTSSQARAKYLQSFEDGYIPIEWQTIDDHGVTETLSLASTPPAGAATDGTAAMQVTSSYEGYDQQFKLDGLIGEFGKHDTIELDLFVPAIDPNAVTTQAALVVNSADGGSHTAPSQNLVQGMNHLKWNYRAGGANPSGAWGFYGLNANTDSGGNGNPISPYYIDNVKLSNTDFRLSFENGSTDGFITWTGGSKGLPDNTSSVNVAGGAPAGAITDGDYALRVNVGDRDPWTIHNRLDSSLPADPNPRLLEAMRDNTTLEFDIYVKDGDIADGEQTLVGMSLNNGGFFSKFQAITSEQTGAPVPFSWNYAAEDGYDDEFATFVQLQFLSLATDDESDPENPVLRDPISEFYIDNLRFTSPEPVVGIPGDFDDSGTVDGADFLAWQRDTNVGSLADWQAHYGETTPAPASASASAVPEPTSLALCLLGGLLTVSRRRR